MKKLLFDQVSYLCSKSVTKEYSTSFSLAVKMLGNSIQNDIHAIYGFVRFADEIVDSFQGYDKELLLNEFEVNLNLALKRKISLNPILNSFQHVVHKYNIDYNLIQAFMNSMRMDLSKENYYHKDEYNEYIYGSADVVGLMCLKVFLEGDSEKYEKLKPSAQKLGSAFQKVNFLRDLKDDTEELNRSYFPNLDFNNLNKVTKDNIINDIENDFEKALVGIKKLPKNSRFGVYRAYIYYKMLLRKLKNTQPEKIKESRIRVSNPIKIGLLAKSYLDYKMNLL